MKILFVPQSFPGPFRYTAARLAAEKGNKVLFVTGRTRRDVHIPGIGRLLVNFSHVPPMGDRAEYEAVRALRHGGQVANVLMRLKNTGFSPDITITNAGQGFSLYVKDVFPQTNHIVYADSFYQEATFCQIAKKQPTTCSALGKVRNFFQWDALRNSKLAYTSTNWQKSCYPEELSPRIKVLHEGIDTNFFSYTTKTPFIIDGCNLSEVKELVTFSGRSADFNQAFPQFLHGLASVLKERPQCHALVVGLDNKETQTAWLNTIGEKYNLDASRIHCLGFLPYNEYRKLLHASAVHVFLSAPLSLSSGLFEAMSCGCLVLGSDTAPIREVIKHGVNGFLYNLDDIDTFSQTVSNLLNRNKEMDNIRLAARQTMVESYNSQVQTPKIIDLIKSSLHGQ